MEEHKVSISSLIESYNTMTVKEVLEKFDISYATLYGILDDYGIQRKRPGTRRRKIVVEE